MMKGLLDFLLADSADAKVRRRMVFWCFISCEFLVTSR
jgi:hypothetical protein